MKLNRISIWLLIIGIIMLNTTYGQITLEYCQSESKKNYPLVKKYNLIEQSKEYSLSNANSMYYPQLSITAIAGMVDGMPEINVPGQESTSSDYNLISMIQLNQNIWDGGITSSNKEVIKAESAIESADLDISFNKLEERVNNIYFGILLINENINLLKIYQDNLNRNLKNINTAVENGTAYKSDLDEVKVQLLKNDQKETELKFNRKAYIEMLSVLIGRNISDEEVFKMPESNASVISLAIKRPELALFKNQRKLVQAKYDISQTFLYPKIGLMGIGIFIEPGINFATSEITRLMVGGLNLSWEIGGLYKSSNNNQLAQIGLEKVTSIQETFLFNTKIELGQSEKEIEKIKILIEKDVEIVRLKESIKNSYQVKYKNGVSTMSELLNKINDENLAKQDKALHKIQYLMASYKYKNLTGN